jgi:hypothetical protein
VAITIALRHVPESRDPETHRLDVAGALLATSGLGALVYGLIETSALGFGDPVVLAALILGTVALSAFVFVERRDGDPMVPPSLSTGLEPATFSRVVSEVVSSHGAIRPR